MVVRSCANRTTSCKVTAATKVEDESDGKDPDIDMDAREKNAVEDDAELDENEDEEDRELRGP